jgi:WD40 repeat protein/tetratricopeptide (TPR) repeat protein
MRLAANDWATGQSRRLLNILNGQLPKPGRPDHRGWEWLFLFSQCHAARFTLPFQVGPVAWSPDGRAFATADPMGVIHTWDANSGEPKGFFKGCPGRVRAICWSPNGQYLAAGSDRSPVLIWEIAGSRTPAVLHGHGAPISAMEWNSDSVRLASGALDGTVCVWDRRTGNALRAPIATRNAVQSLKWHPEGKELLVAFSLIFGVNDYRVENWDTASGKVKRCFTAKADVGTLSPDVSRIVLSGLPPRITDLNSRETVSLAAQPGAFNYAWSPRGDRVAAAVITGSIKILSAQTGAETLSVHAHLPQGADMACSPDGSLLASWNPWDNQSAVSVWDIAAAPRVFSTPGRYALSVAFSPDGNRLLVGARYGLLTLYKVASGEQTLWVRQDAETYLTCVAWSPDGKRFAAPIDPHSVIVYDAATGKSVLGPLEVVGLGLHSLAWSPDGKVLAVGWWGFGRHPGGVQLFSAATGNRLASLPCGGCECVRWSPDGRRLAAGGWGAICIWNSALAEERTISGPGNRFIFRGLDWSPDGKCLAAGSDDGSVTIHDVTGGRPMRVLGQHGGEVAAIRWHPHMPRLATGGSEHEIKIWDTDTGQEICTLQAHSGPISALDWSPDGLRLASASKDCTARLWDASGVARFFNSHGELCAQASRLFQEKKYSQALDILKRLRGLHPQEKGLEMQVNCVEWLRATQLACDGQLDASVAVFRELNARAPDLPDYRLRLPWALFEQGRETQAIEMLQRLVAESPATREYREELAFVYERKAIKLAESGQLEDIIPIFRKLVKEFPERHLHRLALLCEITLNGSDEAAVAFLRKLAGEFPEAIECRVALARNLLALGHLEEAIAIDPGRGADTPDAAMLAVAFVGRSDEAFDHGDLEKALSDLDQAIQYDPAYSEAYCSRGAINLTRGEFGKADADLSKAIDLAPDDLGVRRLRALSRVAAGRLDEYRQDCAEMLRRFAQNETADNPQLIAWTCALAPGAVADWSKPIALAESSQHVGTLGAVLFRAGRLEDAIRRLEEADRLVPNPREDAPSSPAYVWFLLAMAHRRAGHADEAKIWFDKAARWTDEALGGSATDKRSPPAWNRRITLNLLRAEAAELLGVADEPRAGKDKPKELPQQSGEKPQRP